MKKREKLDKKKNNTKIIWIKERNYLPVKKGSINNDEPGIAIEKNEEQERIIIAKNLILAWKNNYNKNKI